MRYEQDFKSKRIDKLACVSTHFVKLLYLGYSVEFQGTENLRQLGDQGAIILPPHFKKIDIPFEGIMLYSAVGKYGSYLMKSTLAFQSLLEWLGGVPIFRPQDLRRVPKEMREQARKQAEDYRESAYNRLFNHLVRDEPVVVHIEGTTKHPAISIVDKGKCYDALTRLFSLQDEYYSIKGHLINWVPLDIIYGERDVIRRNVVFKAGSVLQTENIDELVNHLAKEVHSFQTSSPT